MIAEFSGGQSTAPEELVLRLKTHTKIPQRSDISWRLKLAKHCERPFSPAQRQESDTTTLHLAAGWELFDESRAQYSNCVLGTRTRTFANPASAAHLQLMIAFGESCEQLSAEGKRRPL